MSDYTGDPNAPWDVAIELPDDGPDERDAASVNVPIEALIDRTEALRAGKIAPVASRFRMLGHAEFDWGDDTQPWRRRLNTGLPGGWREDTHSAVSASPHKITFPLEGHVPNGASVKSFRAKIDPAQTHGVTMPTQKPRLQFFKVQSGGNVVLIAEVVDPSASVAAYEAMHNIDLALGTPEVINRTDWNYYVVFSSESGPDAKDDLSLVSMRVEFSHDTVDQGAG